MVEVVLSVTRSHTLEVGEVVSHLLDPLHLHCQVVRLNEVTHLWEGEGTRDTCHQGACT